MKNMPEKDEILEAIRSQVTELFDQGRVDEAVSMSRLVDKRTVESIKKQLAK